MKILCDRLLVNNPCLNSKQQSFSSKNNNSQSNSKILTFKSAELLPLKNLTNSDRRYIQFLISGFQANNKFIEFLGKGTFGLVYKISLPLSGSVAVKILKDNGAKLNYGGGNLKHEAEILQEMPKECKRTQKLIDFFSADGRDYLVTTFIKGEPLSKVSDISQQLLDNIVDELYKYDANGLMFYDLNPNNIKVHNNNAGFFDFEFMSKRKTGEMDCSALRDAHHIDRNLYFPKKSNINAFENRALGQIIEKLPEDEANELVRKYLNSLSSFYSKRADTYPPKSRAAFYDRILADIYSNPNDDIVSIEKDLITLRSFTLNYHLYRHRLENNDLLENDLENYGNFSRYVQKVDYMVYKIREKLDKDTWYGDIAGFYADNCF